MAVRVAGRIVSILTGGGCLCLLPVPADEEKAIYNPKNLPLGWDGKPIPYWLYKLHGLNIEYNCEICGNYKYYGPRSFDRHFSEWRHTHGLKCLGIAPDLFKYFHGVTEIEDALSLVKTLKSQTKLEFQSERDEECEELRTLVAKLEVSEVRTHPINFTPSPL